MDDAAIHEHGVGFVLSPECHLHDVVNVVPGRILQIRLTIQGTRLCALSVYAPTEEYSASAKNSFYDAIQQAVTQAREKFPSWRVIVGGDLNATVGLDCERSQYIGDNHGSEYLTNDNGKRLCQLAQSLELFALNTLYRSKTIHRKTWISNSGKCEKRLDYF